jgi:hypothetical protein
MFKACLFATALVAVEAWERNVKDDYYQTGAYGTDNQHYGHQGQDYGHGYGSVNRGADAHNSHRQSGHQGQGHNQWVDNAWNQWGTNNHWDTQKSVDNKWGNQSGKINVTLNSVSGHYDNDYGQQQRGIGYEGHQNTSGDVGYTIGLGGHSFGYDQGSHSYGYDNDADYGYGGWANNLGAWNHGANYDNFGSQHHDGHTRGVANEALDTTGVKDTRRAGYGYADLEELEDTERRDEGDQYARGRVASLTDLNRGTGHNNQDYGYDNRGYGVEVQGAKRQSYRNGSYGGSDQGYGLAGGDRSYGAGYGSYGAGYGDRSYGYGNGYGDRSYGSYGDSRSYGRDSYDQGYGYGDRSYGKNQRSYGRDW